MTDWQHTYDPRDLNYLSARAKRIHETAEVLGVPALGLAGGIARELTLSREVYLHDPLIVAARPMKEFLTSNEADSTIPDSPMSSGRAWKPISHKAIADSFALSNTPGGIIKMWPETVNRILNKLSNPVFWDVGPGGVNIRTGIQMLQNYNRMFPDSDPLDLKRYNDRYDLLVRDLKNPDSDTTIKIAGLVAREGHDFFAKAMTPQRWGALSEDQRAAALTKYYAVGKERMEDDFVKRGGDPNTYTPDFNGDGSDMYLYDPGNGSWSNPARLRDALSPGQRTQNAPDTQPSRAADFASGMNNASMQQVSAAQRTGGSVAPAQPGSSPLAQQVVANGDYLTANGFAITPRTMYVAHVIGPQRAVDLFRRTGSTASPDVPSPDAATGEQMRAWARALRGYGSAAMPPAGGIAATPDASPGIADAAPADAGEANGLLA